MTGKAILSPELFCIVPKIVVPSLFMLTKGKLGISIKANNILADIISDEWPESLYHDALVMTIGKVTPQPHWAFFGKQTGSVCFFVFI